MNDSHPYSEGHARLDDQNMVRHDLQLFGLTYWNLLKTEEWNVCHSTVVGKRKSLIRDNYLAALYPKQAGSQPYSSFNKHEFLSIE